MSSVLEHVEAALVSAAKWEVQQLMSYGWDNVWSVEHPGGEREPLTFASEAGAEQALDDHLFSLMENGMLDPMNAADVRYNDFRVVPVGTTDN